MTSAFVGSNAECAIDYTGWVLCSEILFEPSRWT